MDSQIVIIRSNSVEVRGRPWLHTMSKQPNVELPIVTAEHSLGKSTTVKRKRDRPNKQTDIARSEELPDMCAEHGLEKSSESKSEKWAKSEWEWAHMIQNGFRRNHFETRCIKIRYDVRYKSTPFYNAPGLS